MKKSTKIIIIISSIVVIGAAIMLIPRLKKDEDETKDETKDEGGQSGQSGQSGQASSSLPSTGFTSKAQGDAFRLWVNTKYPAWAKTNNLDKSGKYDNNYIRKAYQKFGAEYRSLTANPLLLVARNLDIRTGVTGTSLSVPFGISGHTAVFYNNGRFSIHKQGLSGYISKGNYSNGGKTMTITDGLKKGMTLNSSFVRSNLLKTV